MRPSTALRQHREAIYRAAARFRTANPRYFGSTLRGEDSEGSDLDVIVDPLPGTTLFDLGGLQDELENLLGIPVDVVTPRDIPPQWRETILAEAQPV